MYRRNTQGWMKHLDFILLDILCLNIAFAAAHLTRNGWYKFFDEEYVQLAVVLTLVDFVCVIINETMTEVLKRGYYVELSKTVKHVLLIEAFAIAYMFIIKESATFSRIMFAIFPVYYVILSYAVRIAWKKILCSSKDGHGIALYVVATSDRVEEILKRYASVNPKHYLMAGICVLDCDRTGESVQGIPVNSTRDTLLQFLCREWIDEVVVSCPDNVHFGQRELVDELVQMGITVHVEMDSMSNASSCRQVVENIADTTVISISMNMMTTLQALLKRGVDIIGGLVGCLVTIVLVLFIGPMIYINSPGPIFFTQTRVGRNGSLFKIHKFRSMYMDAEAQKARLMAENQMGSDLMFKLDYDPRIIGCKRLADGTIKKGIGNFIRDWSLDEFPQFWNCLKGDMSLVGTRPPTIDEWEKYDLHHRARLAIKPGITGMWQVSGRSKITNFEEVLELDKMYIREWSMGLDFRILLQTIKAVLHRDGAM